MGAISNGVSTNHGLYVLRATHGLYYLRATHGLYYLRATHGLYYLRATHGLYYLRATHAGFEHSIVVLADANGRLHHSGRIITEARLSLN
jgi:hypothetical protein